MNSNYLKPLLLVFAFCSLFPLQSHATHLRAGEITVSRSSCSSLKFIITITVYTNTGSSVIFSQNNSGLLSFDDGTFHNPLEQQNEIRPELGEQIGIVSYSIEHTFPGPGQYTISYLEANRNAGILNMFASVETKFYLETMINIDPFLGCDNSPVLLVPPIDKACSGSAWYHNPGAYDPDGDSLSYEMTIPKQEKNREVNNYRSPANKEFYDRVGIAYETANETKDGKPDMTINALTGTLLWNAPGAPGEYNIAFIIKEWRKRGNKWQLLGYVTRDMQIIVEDCNNRRPELQAPADICVEAGTKIDQDIFGFDPDGDKVKIEAFSEVFSIFPSPAVYSPNTIPATYQPSGPGMPAQIKFEWQTTCEHIKQQSYQVVFKISDQRPKNQGPTLVQFKTWNIRVVGPAPEWKDATVNQQSETATLNWNLYQCQNASIIQVWRRIDASAFTPPECVTGMPSFLEFNKITDVPATQSAFIDNNNGKGLSPGVTYCYRLVAVFPAPGGGESYVSKEICLPPILADAPVITNVSVDQTSTQQGRMVVRWRSPFELDKIAFPPPYTYEVYRAEGFSGDNQLIKPHVGQLTDSIFIDTEINTEQTVFNYRVIGYDNNNKQLDQSAVASSVRLTAESKENGIDLVWSFDVPWSNTTVQYPRHWIYRGAQGQSDEELTLIDSVNINGGAFRYTDTGQYNQTPLNENDTYCYRIMTRGSYGNPKIKDPLINFSQVICARTNDKEPPCTPVIVAEGTGCDSEARSSSCDQTLFSNTLKWRRPSDDLCRADISGYKIYVSKEKGLTDRTLLASNVTDTFFVHSQIPSYAMCYSVVAVDHGGNESEMSETFCFDNCPNFELPNVFTPNHDNCNDVFSAFSDRAVLGEGTGDGLCGAIDPVEQKIRCARFVEKVHFTVVNRWGKRVYEYYSGSENSIYIDWDGRDSDGKELSAGVYYYVADVTFNVVDPDQREQTLHSWVHLLR